MLFSLISFSGSTPQERKNSLPARIPRPAFLTSRSNSFDDCFMFFLRFISLTRSTREPDKRIHCVLLPKARHNMLVISQYIDASLTKRQPDAIVFGIEIFTMRDNGLMVRSEKHELNYFS